jgi:hypothetical protein
MIEEIMDTYYEPINWGLAEINFFNRAKGELECQTTGCKVPPIV